METGENRKINLEDLSKEELVKKCKGLVGLLQKAKCTKEGLQEENSKLKERLSRKIDHHNSGLNELLEKLTDEKLVLVTQIDDLKLKNNKIENRLKICEEENISLQEKFSSLETENISYNRQVKRLTDENEQLLTDLSMIENQITELKSNENSLKDLQDKLTDSLEEVKNLNSSLKSKEKEINELSQELQALKIIRNSSINNSNNNCDTYVKEINELKIKNQSYSKEIVEIKNINQKLKDKVTLYHLKLKKFAQTIKEIREEKVNVLQVFKAYTEQITQWKEQLSNASIQLVKLVNELENENKILKKNHSKEATNNELVEKLKAYEEEINNLKSEQEKTIEELRSKNQNMNEELLTYKEKLDKFNSELIEKETQLKEVLLIKDQCEIDNKNLCKSLHTCKEENIVLKEEEEKLTKEILNLTFELDEKNEKDMINYKDKLEKINNELILKEKSLEEVLSLKEKFEIENQHLSESLLAYEDKISVLTKDLTAKEIILKDLSESLFKCKEELNNVSQECVRLREEKEKYLCDIKNLNEKIASLNQESVSKEDILKEENENLNFTIKRSMETEILLAEKSSEEIIKLAQSNKELEEQVANLQDELQHFKNRCVLNNFAQTELDELTQENTIDLKRENSELLLEMNQMNQVIKERGEIISKLEAHCEEIKKRLQLYETQANKNVDSITEKEETIRVLTEELESLKNGNLNLNDTTMENELVIGLKAEIETLKEKLNASMDTSYAESETMSTSTISRSEEVNRLKDLEGSWEERYGKLRTLALKLKAKIRDQGTVISQQEKEKDELQKKLSSTLKTVQNLHNQIDTLQDNVDKVNADNKTYLNKLNTVAESISKDKQLLVENEETLTSLRKEIEKLTTERQGVETWKKQVGAKVQTLRKELEAKNLLIKDFEGKISKLEADLENKDVLLKTEQESHKQTKNLLDQTSNESKKNSVLNLEMQDYERSVKELSQKVEKQKEEIGSLQTQVDTQKSTINALKVQNKLLEERIQEEEKNGNTTSIEISAFRKTVAHLEDVVQQKEDKILDLTRIMESSRSENEELNTELSKVIAEHQKSLNALKTERDQLRNQLMSLQQSLRETQHALKLKEDELMGIKEDHETYRIRAQSVLKKSQNRDLALEERLLEEVNMLKSRNSEQTNELKDLRDKLESSRLASEEMAKERDELKKRCQELENEVEELKNFSEQLGQKYQKTVTEHAETVRNLKVHAETLSQCYRQQLSEQEVRHNREIIELQSRLEKAPSPVETTPVHPNMPREEGEGSESIESNPPPNNVHPIPLERLLDSKTDDEVMHLKKQLVEQESKLVHLTALLSDTEQDLAKHVQMNKLLKEEIRRQQRSVEREKHAENLEYLKNVVFKFVTLNNGDERSRLVPVLNTILKLSPEETQKLNLVAKGDPGIKGWASYLPMWSSPNKPQ